MPLAWIAGIDARYVRLTNGSHGMIRLRTIFLVAAAILMALGLWAPASSAKTFPPIGTIPNPDSNKLMPFPVDQFARMSCKDLITLKLAQGNILKTEVIPAGTYPAPNNGFPLMNLPKFCRVVGVATPTSDSLIGFEVWIPYDGSYRRRYLQVGNGGFSGDIGYIGLAEGIRRGYATASTDDGSQRHGSADFVLGHPQKVTDYGHRALKQTTDKAKFIVKTLMGTYPERSYFHGCSNGGREALMEAQRYPNDFDGIVVGAPANYFTHQFTGFVWNSQQIYPPPASVIPNIPSSLLPILSSAVQAQCAGHDGGLSSDKFLTNPPACRVNFAPITCTASSPPGTCLTLAQVGIVKAIYDGPVRDDGSNARIFPGFEPGAEAHACNWGMWITGKPTGEAQCGPEALPHIGLQALFGWGFFGFFVNHSALYNIHALNFSSDIDNADATLGPDLNAIDPDLHVFHDHGGKLIQYHGFDDTAVAPQNSIDYWAQVDIRMRAVEPGFSHADLDNFYRLFMAPGMSHCAGGPGATAFGNLFNGSAPDADHDVLRAMEHWVEDGVAPERIVAQHLAESPSDPYFERPLCVYPKLPHYNGSGDPNVAANWSCVAPSRFPVIHYLPERLLPERRY